MAEIPPDDRVHSSAVRYLLDKHKEEAAKTLLSCDLHVDEYFHWIAPDEGYMDGLEVELTAQRDIYEIITNSNHHSSKLIYEAIQFALNVDSYHLKTRLELPAVAPDWRETLLASLNGGSVTNQGNPIGNFPGYLWNNLRFRSKSEIKIAEALEEAYILFFPNCMARLGPINNRTNKEADFLICHEGKWGILEVDGEMYHSTAAKDHERDRFFRSYGIRIVERYTANQCYNNPKSVVKQFLDLLQRIA